MKRPVFSLKNNMLQCLSNEYLSSLFRFLQNCASVGCELLFHLRYAANLKIPSAPESELSFVRYQDITAVNVKTAIFWDIDTVVRLIIGRSA
jgi:hypothetical protein